MKTIKILFFIVMISSFAQSCRKGCPYAVRGRGSLVTETRSLDNFDKIQLSVDADLIYVQDSVYRVEITAQSNIQAILEAKVRNNRLTFEFRRNVWDYKDVTIVVHAPTVSELAISGSGEISVENTLHTNNLELKISGSGSIDIQHLEASHLKSSISGSGDIEISGGTLKSQYITISGSGDFEADACIAETSQCRISGSGEIQVYVTESLDVTISGSGNLRYRGRPAITSKMSGSGRLISLD